MTGIKFVVLADNIQYSCAELQSELNYICFFWLRQKDTNRVFLYIFLAAARHVVFPACN